jgi:hypothetical protein
MICDFWMENYYIAYFLILQTFFFFSKSYFYLNFFSSYLHFSFVDVPVNCYSIVGHYILEQRQLPHAATIKELTL